MGHTSCAIALLNRKPIGGRTDRGGISGKAHQSRNTERAAITAILFHSHISRHFSYKIAFGEGKKWCLDASKSIIGAGRLAKWAPKRCPVNLMFLTSSSVRSSMPGLGVAHLAPAGPRMSASSALAPLPGSSSRPPTKAAGWRRVRSTWAVRRAGPFLRLAASLFCAEPHSPARLLRWGAPSRFVREKASLLQKRYAHYPVQVFDLFVRDRRTPDHSCRRRKVRRDR